MRVRACVSVRVCVSKYNGAFRGKLSKRVREGGVVNVCVDKRYCVRARVGGLACGVLASTWAVCQPTDAMLA